MRRARLFITILLCLFTYTHLLASGPVTHAYLTLRFFDYFPNYTPEQQKEFMIGTLFPDIRYLGQIDRSETHAQHVTINQILEEKSPFIAGMKYHAWVDEHRGRYVNRHPMRKRVHALTDTHHSTYLKMIEDELVFAERDWTFCCEWLQDIMNEELEWGMGERVITKWHTLVSLSLHNSPSTILFLLNNSHQGMLNIPATTVEKWHNDFAKVSQSLEMKHFVNGLNGHFESLLQQAKRAL